MHSWILGRLHYVIAFVNSESVQRLNKISALYYCILFRQFKKNPTYLRRQYLQFLSNNSIFRLVTSLKEYLLS